MHERIAVGHQEPASHVVEDETELRVAADGFCGGAIGSEAKIAVPEVNRWEVGPLGRGDHAAHQSARDMDPAVGSQGR